MRSDGITREQTSIQAIRRSRLPPDSDCEAMCESAPLFVSWLPIPKGLRCDTAESMARFAAQGEESDRQGVSASDKTPRSSCNPDGKWKRQIRTYAPAFSGFGRHSRDAHAIVRHHPARVLEEARQAGGHRARRGANVGYISAVSASRAGHSGEVHGFEPLAECYTRMECLRDLNPGDRFIFQRRDSRAGKAFRLDSRGSRLPARWIYQIPDRSTGPQ
jgi:hypothetical protein